MPPECFDANRYGSCTLVTRGDGRADDLAALAALPAGEPHGATLHLAGGGTIPAVKTSDGTILIGNPRPADPVLPTRWITV